MIPDVARRKTVGSRLPPKSVSRGSPSAVVVKSLAEIKREKMSRMQPRSTSAAEAVTKNSEPQQSNRRESKTKLSTPQGSLNLMFFLLLCLLCSLFSFCILYPLAWHQQQLHIFTSYF